jgi:putative transposase
MIRLPATAFPGCPHHIVPRGKPGQDVFLTGADREDFLDTLGAAAVGAGLQIWAYALMRNHVHLIAVPDDRESVSAIVRGLEAYEGSFNRRRDRDDGLWHPRCHAAVIEPAYFWRAVRYVERNPLRAGIVARSEDYRWSSAAYHCGFRDSDPLISPGSPLKGALADWSAWLAEPDREGHLVHLRRKERERRPDERPEFIAVLDRVLDRRIRRADRPAGRE